MTGIARKIELSAVIVLALGGIALAACVHSGPHSGGDRTPSESAAPPELAGLNAAERLGREIWYNSTAGNSRYHTYAFAQRVMGHKIKWSKVLGSSGRGSRFDLWGLINDPGCCAVTGAGRDREACCERLAREPGALAEDRKACFEATPATTYGFDFCPGDSTLLSYVGRTRSERGVAYNDARANPEGRTPYRLDREDPACALDRNDQARRVQDACDLDFGTSTGVLGYRKFPNPRFDQAAWTRRGGWGGFEGRTADHSLEPPFLVGISCGACHIGLDPTRPPRDPNAPEWINIRGLVGNQFVRNAVVLGSGVQPNPHNRGPSSLEWEEFAHERPGATDTSAIPNDQVTNPGTMNAIINLSKRPHGFREKVITWYQERCDHPNDPKTCWEDPQWHSHPGGPKFWNLRENSKTTDSNYTVYHVLKGGEDSIGAAGAVQRVYINIGSCAEECWLNHLTDLRVLLPHERGYGQTPFSIAQCRRDCPAWRAIEDRVPEIFQWLQSAKPLPLAQAREAEPEAQRTLQTRLSQLLTPANIEAGRKLFIEHRCSQCHSSNTADTSFGPDNWMSNDRLVEQARLGTYACRAKHSNHQRGRVWAEFASETRKDLRTGYYKVPSLLNVWAYAPFMHNNGMGPEVCSRAERAHRPEEKWFTSPYAAKDAPACTPFPTTVLERFEVFERSVQELLTPPNERLKKVTLTDRKIDYPLIGAFSLFGKSRFSGAVLRLPAGLPVGLTGSFKHKEWIGDLLAGMRDPAALKARLEGKFKPEEAAQLLPAFQGLRDRMLNAAEGGETDAEHRKVFETDPATTRLFFRYYSTCDAEMENSGHAFGTEIGKDRERLNQLIAFLATL